MRYVVNKDNPERILIEPEYKEDLIKFGIYFWSAEIFTRNNINTISYRFNVTAVVNANFFKEIYPKRWKQLNHQSSDMLNVKTIDKNFTTLLTTMNLKKVDFTETTYWCGGKIGGPANQDIPMINLDAKHESIQKVSATGLDTKAETTFRIDVHIYSAEYHDLNPGIDDSSSRIKTPFQYINILSELMLEQTAQLSLLKVFAEEVKDKKNHDETLEAPDLYSAITLNPIEASKEEQDENEGNRNAHTSSPKNNPYEAMYKLSLVTAQPKEINKGKAETKSSTEFASFSKKR